jgi:hypothetical protein
MAVALMVVLVSCKQNQQLKVGMMTGTAHHGENRGDKTVILYMFYLSKEGMPLSVPHSL